MAEEPATREDPTICEGDILCERYRADRVIEHGETGTVLAVTDLVRNELPDMAALARALTPFAPAWSELFVPAISARIGGRGSLPSLPLIPLGPDLEENTPSFSIRPDEAYTADPAELARGQAPSPAGKQAPAAEARQPPSPAGGALGWVAVVAVAVLAPGLVGLVLFLVVQFGGCG